MERTIRELVAYCLRYIPHAFRPDVEPTFAEIVERCERYERALSAAASILNENGGFTGDEAWSVETLLEAGG